jgi:trans-AT polyketide synthase/acyltransferase/oxidoreductase domain-containing protein
MGRDVLDLYPGLVEAADEILGYSIRTPCLEDPDNQLGETKYCQPALYVVSALMFLARRRQEPWPDFIAGHSLGEYNALFAAGVFDFETGVRLVRCRGELMASVGGGSMLAVIGPTLHELSALVDELSLQAELSVANYNLPTQTVMSGPSEAIGVLADAILDRQLGRAVHLHIGGAFHSRFAEPAALAFEAELDKHDLRDPQTPTISNVTARPYAPGTVRALLATQMRRPVRWVEVMSYLRSQGVVDARQIGPGRVLDGLWERFDVVGIDAVGARRAGTGRREDGIEGTSA